MDNMKRRNKIIALMFFLALVLTVFAACGGESNSFRLPSPINLQINGTTLTWDEVENASGYVVYFENVEHETEQNNYDLSSLTKPGTYAIEVMAVGDGIKYEDSDWSQVKEYIIETEQSLEFKFYNKTTSKYEVAGIGTITSNEIVVPATYNGLPVVCIGLRAFENNVDLKSVTLPDSILHIKAFAFAGCKALESIDLPNSLTSIQRSAFSGSGLKTLNIPDSVDNIPYHIIDDCLNLESIRLSEGLRVLASEFFSNTPKLKSVTLPESTHFGLIGNSAFVGSSIESITIPKSVHIISENAFENTIIHSIEFENGSELHTIDKLAFKGCNNLESIIIPASVTTIGRNAFSNCANLRSVTFEKNSQLTTLNVLFQNSGITEFTIPKSVTTLESMTFDGLSTLETIRFEDNSEVTILPMQMFYQCTNLTTVDFGKNSKIETIGANAFGNCSKLATINIPQSVTSIESMTFSNATAMKSIIIPSSVATMGNRVFAGWTENQTINIEERMEAPAGWNSNWYNKSNATVVWGFQSK